MPLPKIATDFLSVNGRFLLMLLEPGDDFSATSSDRTCLRWARGDIAEDPGCLRLLARGDNLDDVEDADDAVLPVMLGESIPR